MQSIFTSLNIKLFAVSIVFLTVGFVLLGQGPVTNPLSMSVAPVLLVIVYLVLIPIAILARSKNTAKEQLKK